MDKKDLKNKIENLYQLALGINDSRFIVGLDGVKSILGIDLNGINTKPVIPFLHPKNG